MRVVNSSNVEHSPATCTQRVSIYGFEKLKQHTHEAMGNEIQMKSSHHQKVAWNPANHSTPTDIKIRGVFEEHVGKTYHVAFFYELGALLDEIDGIDSISYLIHS